MGELRIVTTIEYKWAAMHKTTLHTEFTGIPAEYLVEKLLLDLGPKKPLSKMEVLQYVMGHSSIVYLLNVIESPQLSLKNNFVQCLLHQSFVNEFELLKLTSNEKLEFLGDSVVGLYFSQVLYHKYPKLDEGELSRFRSSLVNEESLASLGRLLKLDSCLILGKGEFLRQAMNQDSLVSDCFEALIGFIYLDGGEKEAFRVLDCVLILYKKITGNAFIDEANLESFDAKTRLQELTMKLFQKTPKYVSRELSDGSFQVTLELGEKSMATMNHISKKKATKLLAKKVLDEKLYEISEEELC